MIRYTKRKDRRKLNENQISKILLIIVVIFTIILTIVNLKILDFLFIINGYEIISNKITTVFSIFALSYSVILYLMPLFENIIELIYIKTNETDENDIEIKYYRELVEKYSVGALVKCYGKKVNSKDQLVGTLLRLILNKKLEFNNQTIEIIDENDLSPSEFMFVKSCKDCSVYTKRKLKMQIEEDNNNDAIQTDLFCKSSIDTSNIELGPLMLGIFLWLLNFIAIILAPIIYKNNMGILLSISFISHFLIILSLFACKRRVLMYRTEKGKEIQHKLIGLKNFLKDYSNINNKKIKEIELWDDYIIYAIIFNLKGKINIEAYQIYKKYIEKLIQ